MSKKKQKTTEGGKKRSLIILLVLLVSLGACALAGYAFYEIKSIKKQVTKNEPQAAPAPALPVYVPLETFTVSLRPDSDEADHVLYIGLTIRVQNEESKKLLENFLPEIRSRLLILFSQQTSAMLATDEGKAKLIQEIKTVVSKPLAERQSVKVTDVLFNAFILR
ncbi:flagellar basal body-associated protein FliL [Enterobacter pasteurii]|uniref:flagellar basal body-associated protein FliL n=1 Tax=Enterobacter pasteurii TaxID=3029761 RepID=UPI0011DCDB95|nr:flagellar basal body-associated protein FliL [Enterobacter pasteurii]QLA68081.1 flagellar basal body-associated protein FliL [Enterobacter pasteurii]